MTRRFRDVAERVLDSLLADAPEWALGLGDTRGAHRLTDYSVEADARRVDVLTDALGSLDEIDADLISADDQVDLEMLRTRISADLWHTAELRPHTWDPLYHSPGEAVHALLERDTLPAPERLEALAARCAALPAYLKTARDRLSAGPGMPRVHVETALGQLEGARTMLSEAVPALAAEHPEHAAGVGPARTAALAALEEYTSWLRTELEFATADPRLGARQFAAQLWYTLDSELSPDALLVRAESDLLATEEAIAEAAAEYTDEPRRPGQVAEVLSALADEFTLAPEGVVPACTDALEHLDTRVRELDLATVYDDPVSVIPMPVSRRGVAVAYCDPPGPLDPNPHSQPTRLPPPPSNERLRRQPTFIAVAPPPEDWPVERQKSFLREYNAGMLRNLMAHEALPGHALQLAHAARHRGHTRVRSVLMSGTFIEGWAVHSEQVLAAHGWSGESTPDTRRANLALRMVQLKMRLRAILNAILDVRVHTGDITEEEAITLLTERGHQEEGEAVGKWRRALLTSAQLSSYYVGYVEVSDIARDLVEARPDEPVGRIHDAMLAHGNPSPRHLRTLLGLCSPGL
ncbi:DUF885 domain-containing protein [Nocardiopsis exhalans]|uniref:DUF885 domain-containing protein n=1 Tax=Nocardiopsis exhalans TaxID=163604 RepID=A0ABY5DFV6_9ACTN|nr:DUF885 domain-containing protein [Nocardiopsis exhalans]USY23236.1 DUF885 domain-containing protein [Nocardiopsis exhalans]